MIVTPLTAEEQRATGFTHRFDLTEADLTGTVSGTLQDITLFTLAIGMVVRNVAYKLATAFTGGAISAITMSVGDGAGATQFIAAGSVFTAGAAYAHSAASTLKTYTAASTLIARFTPTSDSLVNLTAGSVVILAEIVDLSKVAGTANY